MKSQSKSHAVRYSDEVVSSIWSISLLEIVSLILVSMLNVVVNIDGD